MCDWRLLMKCRGYMKKKKKYKWTVGKQNGKGVKFLNLNTLFPTVMPYSALEDWQTHANISQPLPRKQLDANGVTREGWPRKGCWL